MEIRQLESAQIDNAITLIWTTFLQFDAPDYSEEGIQSFKNFIENREIPELRETMNKIRNNSDMSGMSMKEKSGYAADVIKNIGERRRVG